MIGYLGPTGTFSYAAVHKYANVKENDYREYKSIYSLIKAADSGEIESAFVPIENSLDGSINTTLDTLALDSSLYICGEYTMHIKENLMALPKVEISDIKRILSHPQPIGQCSGMINKHFSNSVIEYTESTAAAAKLITELRDKNTAVIGPAVCAELYGLNILIPECNDEKNNATRFVELKKHENTENDSNKSSFVFAVDNKPGCLFKAIKSFSDNCVNMIKIESRPEKKELGRYIFFIDTDGSIRDENLKKAWEEVNEIAYKCKFLGSYRKG